MSDSEDDKDSGAVTPKKKRIKRGDLKMFRKVVLGSGLVALVPAVRAATPTDPSMPPLMKPSDLPIYDAPHAEYAEYMESKLNAEKASYVRSVLLEPVRAVREQVQGVLERTESIQHSVQDNFHEFQDRTDWIVQYLREEENKEVRYGAVAMGGLTGFIFGLRGGFIRRLLYTGVGTTLMGAVCFPEETKEIAKNNGVLVKQYVNIAYNFLYGVKPGDPQLELKLPELSFPKDFSELVDLTVSVGSTLKQAVMPPPSKDEASTDASKPEKKD